MAKIGHLFFVQIQHYRKLSKKAKCDINCIRANYSVKRTTFTPSQCGQTDVPDKFSQGAWESPKDEYFASKRDEDGDF